MLPLALCKSYFVTGASGSLFCPVSMSPAQRIPTCLGTHLSTVAILAQGTHSGRCGNAGLFAERSNPADASATCLAGARLATPALAQRIQTCHRYCTRTVAILAYPLGPMWQRRPFARAIESQSNEATICNARYWHAKMGAARTNHLPAGFPSGIIR